MTAVVPFRRPEHTPATMTDYQRTMAVANAPLVIIGGTCKAPYGAYCRSKAGNAVPFHPARKGAIADLTDDEKVAAFAALRAAQRRTCEAGRRQMARLATDPAFVARRAAVRAMVDAELGGAS